MKHTNLKRAVKNTASVLAALLLMGMLTGLFTGCPQKVKPEVKSNDKANVVPNEAPKPQEDKITITVQGDEGVIVQGPNTIKVAKGTKWSDAKAAVEGKVSYKLYFEAKGWKLNNADGADLKGEDIFNENKTVFALSKIKEGIEFFTTDGSGTITGCKVNKNTLPATLIIPSKIKEEEITGIKERAFEGCSTLKKVVLPKTLKTIGYNVFLNCSELTVLEVEAENPKYYSANNLCITRDTQEVVVAACGLQVVTVPNEVKLIGKRAFDNYRKLTNLDLSKNTNLTVIGEQAFNACNAAIIKLPASIKEIGSNAFSGCKLVVVPNDEIKQKVLEVTNPDPPIIVGDIPNLEGFYFSDAEKTILTGSDPSIQTGTIQIPASVKTIEEKAFHNREDLVYVDCSTAEGLTTIKHTALIIPYAIIKLPASITTIDENAFFCKWVIVPNDEVKQKVLASKYPERKIIDQDITIEDGFYFKNAEKKVLIGSDPSKQKGDIRIPSSVETIDLWAFLRRQDVISVDFSACKNLKTIGPGAFTMTNISEVKIPASVTQIGPAIDTASTIEEKYSSFSGCLNLTSLTVDDANPIYYSKDNLCITRKTKKLVAAASGLSSIVIPEDLTEIGTGVFFQSLNLTSVDFSKCTNLKAIGEGAFAVCPQLTSVDLSKTKLTTIEPYTFNDSKMAVITLPQTIKTVKEMAFGNTDNTCCKQVIVPNNNIKDLVKNSGYPENRILVQSI